MSIVRRWLDHRKTLKRVQARLKDEPGAVWELFAILDAEFAEHAGVLRRYGLELRAADGDFDYELVAPERLPSNVAEMDEYNDAVRIVLRAWMARRAGTLALGSTGNPGDNKSLRLAGLYMVKEYRQASIYCGLEVGKRKMPEALRMKGVIDASGHLATQFSLNPEWRLGAAMMDEEGLAPFDGLLERLPAAILIEWQGEKDLMRPKELRARVARHLEHTSGRTRPVSAAPVPDDLLDELERAAGLSPQQREIMSRLRRNETISDIAAALGTTKNNVSSQKSQAIANMKKVAEGF